MLAAQAPIAPEFWEKLVGEKVCGGFLLRRLNGSTERSAVYRTAYGEAGADMKLVSAAEDPHEVAALEHPNLMQVYASGTGEANGRPVQYIITEAADQTLAAVIEGRLLTPVEAEEMLRGVLRALTYLHGCDRTHGSIKPSNIFAVGDTVKLSVDSIRPVGVVASADDDMRALGLTILQILTGQQQPSAIADLPQPMRDIVAHALEDDPAQRWTAEQAALRLSGKIPRPIIAPSTSTAAEGPTAAAADVATPHAVGGKEYAEPAVVRPTREREPGKIPVPVWVYPAAGVLALALIVAIFLGPGTSSHSAQTANVQSGAQPSSTVAPKTVAPNAPPAAVRKTQPKPDPFGTASHPAAKSPAKPAAKAPINGSGKGWFVVVASYVREVDAAHMAQTLGRRFPKFTPTVFPPSAIDTHYLVIIGSGLSADRAEALRQQAVSSGLPHDTYIKKYPTTPHG